MVYMPTGFVKIQEFLPQKGVFLKEFFGSITTLNLPFFCNAMRVEEDPEMQVQFKKSIFK